MQRGSGIILKQKYLLDSNSYFRLADNLYPILSKSIEVDGVLYSFCILNGTWREYFNEPRLRTTFDWVGEENHSKDRKNGSVRLKKHQHETILETMKFLLETCRQKHLGCSRFDIECLATAFELSLELVTDDLDLIRLAEEYDFHVLTSLEILDLLLKAGEITMREVNDTVYLWRYFNDLPSRFIEDFTSLFGNPPPVQ